MLSCLLLANTLPKYDIEAELVAWDDPEVNWASYDLVISMGVHDYISRTNEFISWLDMLVAKGIRVCNPVDVVKWNLDKHYLLELLEHGIQIPKTHIVNKEEIKAARIDQIMKTYGWNKCVVKPCVGMCGSDLYLLQTEDEVQAMQEKFVSLYEGRDVILQEFEPGIKQGEYSCFFLGGEYSHSIIKIPAVDDFRAVFIYGASTSRVEPPPLVLATAKRALQSVGKEVLFARVDIFQRDSENLLLMEIETVEPVLYFSFAPECVDKLCKAITKIW